MNRDGADDVLFGAALSCEESQRAAFTAHAVDPALAEAACVRAEACLHAIAVIEDSRIEDEDGPQALALRRIEARLDLLTALVGALARRDQADPLVPLRWSAVGACLPVPAAIDEGTPGTFRVQAAAWLPEPLELPAT
ncbi:MAG TPA: PilZ domain-containing protein, partial [Luteimonas sp.]|nr:PilZ domain-containing protein [Luteimonas sp.]